MATIITVHMTNTNANSIGSHGIGRYHERHAGRDHSKADHVHAAHCHVGREPQQVAPRQRGQQSKREDDDDTVASEDGGLSGRGNDSLARDSRMPKLLGDMSSYLIGLLKRSTVVGAFVF